MSHTYDYPKWKQIASPSRSTSGTHEWQASGRRRRLVAGWGHGKPHVRGTRSVQVLGVLATSVLSAGCKKFLLQVGELGIRK